MKNLMSFLVLAMLLGCSDGDGVGGAAGSGGSGGAGGTGGQDFSPTPPLVIGGDERPAEVDIPTDYDPTVPHPLVIVLHGFGADGRIETGYMQLFDFVDEKQFVLVFPDGTLNDQGERFWNATPACCDPSDSVDDVGYLSGLIAEAEQTYNIDPKRVYLIGHSNGGFMSFRMACEASELITAIVSLAGSTYDDPADCAPATIPVSVLAVHGTADATIPYDGRPDIYPGAVETTERFATAGGCDVFSQPTRGRSTWCPASRAPKPTSLRTRPAVTRASTRRFGRSTRAVTSRSFRPSLPT